MPARNARLLQTRRPPAKLMIEVDARWLQPAGGASAPARSGCGRGLTKTKEKLRKIATAKKTSAALMSAGKHQAALLGSTCGMEVPLLAQTQLRRPSPLPAALLRTALLLVVLQVHGASVRSYVSVCQCEFVRALQVLASTSSSISCQDPV